MIHYNSQLGLSDLPGVVDAAVADLSPHRDEFDSIAVQGVSGAIVGSPVALALGKPLVVVRKDSDFPMLRCEHIHMVENTQHAGSRVLFPDDYVGEGKTLRDVIRKIHDYTEAAVASRYEYTYRAYVTDPRLVGRPRL